MMLTFLDADWPMTVNAWSMGWPAGKAETRISYCWGTDGTAANYMVVIPVGEEEMRDFIKRNKADGACDLRPLQE